MARNRTTTLLAAAAVMAASLAGCSDATEAGAPLDDQEQPAAVAGAAKGPDAKAKKPGAKSNKPGAKSKQGRAARTGEPSPGEESRATDDGDASEGSLADLLPEGEAGADPDTVVGTGRGGGMDPLVFAEAQVDAPERMLVKIDSNRDRKISADWLLTCSTGDKVESSEGSFEGPAPIEHELSLPVEDADQCNVWAGAHMPGRSTIKVELLAATTQ